MSQLHCENGAGGAPRQAQVLFAGIPVGSKALSHACRQGNPVPVRTGRVGGACLPCRVPPVCTLGAAAMPPPTSAARRRTGKRTRPAVTPPPPARRNRTAQVTRVAGWVTFGRPDPGTKFRGSTSCRGRGYVHTGLRVASAGAGSIAPDHNHRARCMDCLPGLARERAYRLAVALSNPAAGSRH